MVQRKTDVIAGNGKLIKKKDNCDYDDSEHQQPISRHHKNGKTMKVGGFW